MSANMSRDSIADRVRRMLAKAQSSESTQAEIEAFAAKASELILEYNLTESEYSAAHAGTAKTLYISSLVQLKGNMAEIAWRRKLIHILAINNFCDTVYFRGTREIAIVGQPDNIEAVLYLYSFLNREVQRLTGAAWKRYRLYGDVKEARFRSTFGDGAVAGIYTKLDREKQAWADSSESRTALVLVKGDEIIAARREFFPNSSAPKATNRTMDTDVYEAGYRAGQDIQIRQGIGTGDQTPKLDEF